MTVIKFVAGVFFSVLVATCARAQTIDLPPDPTGSISSEGRYLPPNATSLEGAFVGLNAPSSDPRVRQWVKLKLAKDHDALLRSVLDDLRSNAAHPWASHVWVHTKWALGHMTAQKDAEFPEGLKEVLSFEAKAFRFRLMERDDLLANMADEALARDEPAFWAEYDIAYANCGMHRFVICRAMFQRLVAQFPGEFGSVFAAAEKGNDVPVETLAWMAGSPTLSNSPANKFISWYLANPDAGKNQLATAIEFWLVHSPHDPNALRRVGYQLEKLKRYDAALDLFKREEAAYPFRDASVRIGRVQAAQRKFSEATETAKNAAQLSQPASAQRLYSAIAELRMLRHAGELGFARTVALSALEKFPKSHLLRVEIATTMRKEGFGKEGIEILKPVLAEDPTYHDAASEMIDSLLSAERYKEALNFAADYRAAGGPANDDILDGWRSALHLLKRFDQLPEVETAVREELPDAYWLRRNLAFSYSTGGQHVKAYEMIREVIIADVDNSWQIDRLRDYGIKANRTADAHAALKALVKRYPYIIQLWKNLGQIRAEVIPTWKEAAKMAPNRGFGYAKAAYQESEDSPARWKSTKAYLTNSISKMEKMNAPAEEIAKLLDESAGLTDYAINKKHTNDTALVEPALEELDKARSMGLAEHEYWALRYFLLSRKGASRELSVAALKHLQLKPDYDGIQGILFDGEVGKFLSNNSMPMDYYWRYMNRRPRSSERLKGFAHRQSKWGGSSVVALAALEQAKRWDPDADVNHPTEYAYGQLGAKKRYFDSNYNKYDTIGQSERYVNWFHNTRKKARETQISIKNLDLKNMSITRLTPEGIEEMRRYHPKTGRLVAFKLGAFEGDILYTDDGHLKKYSAGGKTVVELDHDPVSKDGLDRKISTLQITGRKPLGMKYGKNGKPIWIEVVGLGAVVVEYDDDDEISKLKNEVADSSVESDQVALEFFQTMNTLQTVITQIEDFQKGRLNNFELNDPALKSLKEQVDDARDTLEYNSPVTARRQIALAQYMIANLEDHPFHAQNSEEILRSLFVDFSDEFKNYPKGSEQSTAAGLTTIQAIGQWRRLMLKSRPDGLPALIWENWGQMREWLEVASEGSPAVLSALEELKAEMLKTSLRMLSDRGWLRASHLTNPGFWRTHAAQQIVPKVFAKPDLRMRDILVRRNGDVVVATSVGLSVLRRGYWEWFAFDKTKERLSQNIDYADVDGTSNLSALAEDEEGRLWVGSRAGLMVLAEGYAGDLSLLRSGSDDLFNGGIAAIASHGSEIAVGGDAGLSLITPQNLTVRQVSAEPVERLRSVSTGVIAIGRNKLWYQQDSLDTSLMDTRVTDAMIGPDKETLYILQDKKMLQMDWAKALKRSAKPETVPGSDTIAANINPFGLAKVSVQEKEERVVVLTDMGGSVLGESGFEDFQQPDTNRPVGILAAHESNKRLFMLTTEGIAAIARGEAQYPTTDRVYDLLSDPVLETTFIATGSSIEFIDQKEPSLGTQNFSSVYARILTQAPDGSLVTHDGPTVLRFRRGGDLPKELFSTQRDFGDKRPTGRISSILAANDGAIWATSGATVFHWQEGKELQEYTMFADKDAAPFNSDMLFSVQQAPDGGILVVASDEGHRRHNGRSMEGGLFEYTGKGFEKSKRDILGSWFLTSATNVTDDTAIVGTTSGFARMRGDKLEEFDRIEDASYLALRKQVPALYLGTQGALLGKDLWLFGTAGGVVALRDNTWFYPDRLNWVLPDQQDANYGARTVHAVATDSRGRVYVGTDRGLTLYDPDGGGAASFLVSEQRGDFAFSALEQDKMREVNDILVQALPKESAAGKLAAAFRKKRKELAKLQDDLDKAVNRGAPVHKLEKRILRTQQRDIALLAKLEREHPLVFSMLQLNPLDLRALARKLPEKMVIAQYLPTKTALYINLVSKEGAELRKIDVQGQKLEQITRFVTSNIAREALGKKRFFDVGGAKPTTTDDNKKPAFSSAKSTEALAWLYNQLLRPIEHAIPDGTTLVVSQTGYLAYLPFSALVRESSGGKPEYAIERFNIAAAPSLYALDMILDQSPSTAFSHIIFGDPDGSLGGARAEAVAIADILADDVVELRVGEKATYDELLAHSSDARFVHLAMHGKLDHISPKDSYLLLADNTRMSIPQIMTLPLAEAELVFLSACESGLGSDGLEYRTIAHAFAHAGAPAVVATLWQVDDVASQKLAETFYRAKVDGASNAAALAQAQRDMIKAGGAHAQPGYWAGAVVFGKP